MSEDSLNGGGWAAWALREAGVEVVFALHGGHLGGTTSRLLRLLDQYGDRELCVAVEDAYARGAFTAQSVAHVLEQRRRAQNAPAPMDVVLPDDPRVRDLVVPARSLDVYDVLSRARKEGSDE